MASWDTVFRYESEAAGGGDFEELQVRRTSGGLQFRVVVASDDEDAETETLWTSDKDLGAGDIVEALEEFVIERDLPPDTIKEAAEELEPFLNAAEGKAVAARLED
jgi:hypothetical protein